MKNKYILINAFVCLCAAFAGSWGYEKIKGRNTHIVHIKEENAMASYAGFHQFPDVKAMETPADFTQAAASVFPSVVRIISRISAHHKQQSAPGQDQLDQVLENFFSINPRAVPEQRGTGSGVIISENGYIVTNDHVISTTDSTVADEIIVTTYNNRQYKATVIGRDAATDLAVLKIKADDLTPAMTANSDELKPGQWVLAIGYPLKLDATVTAGIVSGRYRPAGSNREDNRSLSFIQTDAVINQGSSGGALVNAEGKLVGINSAILTSNGAFNGYGFAIPINLVRKIAAKLIGEQ